MDDPLDLEAQRDAKREKARQAKIAREAEEADFRWLMGSQRGRRIVWRLLDRAGVFRLSFNVNAMQMAFAEGCRNEGLRTLSRIHTLCPELYSTMMKEANERRKQQSNDRADAGTK